jgi:hypothetical protein
VGRLIMLEYCERSLRTDIAAHARGRKKVPNETAPEKNFSQFIPV